MSEDKKWEDTKRFIKGRIGEAIVETLLKEAGNKVLRFGQEWRKVTDIIPDSFDYTHRSHEDRLRPDFAIKKRDGNIEYIEAKFLTRLNTVSLYESDDKISIICNNWPTTTFVIVSPQDPCLFALDPHAINEGGLVAEYLRPLWEEEGLGVTEALCKKYAEIIQEMPIHLLLNLKGAT